MNGFMSSIVRPVKADCLNLEENTRECRALDATYCKHTDCPFYKNQEMLDAQVARIRRRIPNYDPKARYLR